MLLECCYIAEGDTLVHRRYLGLHLETPSFIGTHTCTYLHLLYVASFGVNCIPHHTHELLSIPTNQPHTALSHSCTCHQFLLLGVVVLCHLILISCSSFPQAQLRQADAQSVHQHYEEVLSGVRAKATYASKQLLMASMAANQSLRYI